MAGLAECLEIGRLFVGKVIVIQMVDVEGFICCAAFLACEVVASKYLLTD